MQIASYNAFLATRQTTRYVYHYKFLLNALPIWQFGNSCNSLYLCLGSIHLIWQLLYVMVRRAPNSLYLCLGSIHLHTVEDLMHKTSKICTQSTVVDPGFPVGGVDLAGERGLPTRLHFVKFVCQSERIGTLRGGACWVCPSLDPPMTEIYLKVFCPSQTAVAMCNWHLERNQLD